MLSQMSSLLRPLTQEAQDRVYTGAGPPDGSYAESRHQILTPGTGARVEAGAWKGAGRARPWT